MPIYRIALHGIPTPLLVRDDSAAKAKDQILDLKALTTEEMADALAAGETIYRPGDSVLGKATIHVPRSLAAPRDDDQPTFRVNTETGMNERRPNDSDEWASEGSASISDLQEAFGGGTVAVDLASGMVRHLPQGADSETGWVDVREATTEEIAGATPKPKK